MVDLVFGTGQPEGLRPGRLALLERLPDERSGGCNVSKCGELSASVRQTVWILWGTVSISRRRTLPATRLVTLSRNSAEVNLNARSMATNTCGLPLAVRTWETFSLDGIVHHLPGSGCGAIRSDTP